LLHIAGKVQISGKEVSPEDIEKAKVSGATDLEIHDAVLISAVFCLFNRYVDGLSTSLPDDSKAFEEMGHFMSPNEYMVRPKPTVENMAYSTLPENLPGSRGLMAFRPEIAKHLNQPAEELLRSE